MNSQKLILRILFAITNLFGVGNYSLTEDFEVKSSNILRIYCVALFSAISMDFFLNVKLYTDEKYPVIFTLEWILHRSLCLTCFALSIWNQNKVRKWIQSASPMLLAFKEDKLKKICITFAAITLVGLLGFIIFFLVFYVDYDQPNIKILSLLAYCVLNGTVTVTTLLFTLCVLLLVYLFRDINNQLQEALVKSNSRDKLKGENIFFIEYKQYRLKRNENLLNTEKICELREKHSLYCSLTRDLNDCFSCHLLLFVGLSFVEIAYSTFCFTLRDEQNKKLYPLTSLLLKFLTYVLLIFGSSVSTQLLINEGYKSGPLVHKLINSEMRTILKQALEIFSLQIYHSDINVTATGFFSVNNGLLYQMVGYLSSALVMLVQFQKYASPSTELDTL